MRRLDADCLFPPLTTPLVAAAGTFNDVFAELLRPEVQRVVPIWKVSPLLVSSDSHFSLLTLCSMSRLSSGWAAHPEPV